MSACLDREQAGTAASRLRQYRAVLRWSRTELSRRSGVPASLIQEAEQFRVRLDVTDAEKLAAALGITLGTLTGDGP